MSPVMPQPPRKAAAPNAWSMRRPMMLGFIALIVLVGGFGMWGAFASISGAIVASGQIEVEQNRQIVQHPDGGVVAEIMVSEGAQVAAGDILLRLDGKLLAAELAIVEGRLSEAQAQRARLQAERDGDGQISFPEALLQDAKTRPEVAEQIEGQSRLFTARMDANEKEREQLARRSEQIRSQIAGIEAQSHALGIQLELIRQELTSQRALLDKGLTQSASVLALQREEARLLGSVGELTASRAQAEERITEIEVQAGRIEVMRRSEAADDLRTNAPMELELIERRGALRERTDRLDIRAPVSGLVLGLTVTTPRAVIRPAEPVLYIVPQDRPLMIAAQVAPIHIDQVFVGQPVELVFSAFSSRTTPHLRGKVMVVSADALSDQQTRASYYRIEIMLEPGEIAKLGDLVLLPGMPVEAFIQTDERSPMSYLMKPFSDYFNRAFRES